MAHEKRRVRWTNEQWKGYERAGGDSQAGVRGGRDREPMVTRGAEAITI